MDQMRPVVPVLAAVDEGPQQSRVFLCALVVASQVLGQLLMEVEHDIGSLVLADDSVKPQLLHEEHLIRKVLRGPYTEVKTCSYKWGESMAIP